MAVRFKLAEYLRYCRGPPQEEAPLYVFERDFVQLCPKLKDDFHVPKYFDPFYQEPGEPASEKPRPTDLFRLYGERRRPDYRWLIIGSKLSGSVFHIDPNSTNAWNACVRGRKRWILYPPGQEPPPGVLPSSDGADVTLPLGLGEWFLSFWPYHEQRRSHPDPAMRPLEVTVEEGETIFVPHGWWHLVLNMDEVCIAITQNYVSASNVTNVLRFLRDKEDQISGVRDRLQDGEEAHTTRASQGERHGRICVKCRSARADARRAQGSTVLRVCRAAEAGDRRAQRQRCGCRRGQGEPAEADLQDVKSVEQKAAIRRRLLLRILCLAARLCIRCGWSDFAALTGRVQSSAQQAKAGQERGAKTAASSSPSQRTPRRNAGGKTLAAEADTALECMSRRWGDTRSSRNSASTCRARQLAG
eukprot:scaffold7363_cov263-Pinguiococcus_pyrenoidosus.AAC.24